MSPRAWISFGHERWLHRAFPIFLTPNVCKTPQADVGPRGKLPEGSDESCVGLTLTTVSQKRLYAWQMLLPGKCSASSMSSSLASSSSATIIIIDHRCHQACYTTHTMKPTRSSSTRRFKYEQTAMKLYLSYSSSHHLRYSTYIFEMTRSRKTIQIIT